MIRLIPEKRAPRNPRLCRLETPFSVKTRSVDTEAGTFSGIASTNAVDDYGTVIAAGAFDQSLIEHEREGTWPAMLWQHDWYEVCGRWTRIQPNGFELDVDGAWELGTQRGAEGNRLIAPKPRAALNGLSVGFEPDWEETEYVDGVLIFKRVKLWEISVVTFPANKGARIELARNPDNIQTERDLEDTLRDAGFSRSEATAIASRFKPKAEPTPRDAANDAGPDTLRQLAAIFS